jgi:hypothetical protein
MIKRPNLQICVIEEGTKIPTKSIESSFNEILAEKVPILRKDIDIQIYKYWGSK